MRWKVPGKRCSSGMQKATAQRPSRNSNLRSQKLVRRERENQTKKQRQRRMNSADRGRQGRKQNYKKRERRDNQVLAGTKQSYVRSWKPAHYSLFQSLTLRYLYNNNVLELIKGLHIVTLLLNLHFSN